MANKNLTTPFFNPGAEQVEAAAALQKELLDTYEQANRAWFRRVQSEAALWMDLASASMSMTFTSRQCLSRSRSTVMHRQILALAAFVALMANTASAQDRPVTDDERAKLTAAVAAQGCSGGKMEFDIDDNHFEVDDARCDDGRKYDFKFDTSFRLIEKRLD
jgi:hypothetical protein